MTEPSAQPNPTLSGRAAWLAVAAVAIFALALRLINGGIMIRHAPLVAADSGVLDMTHYRAWARALAAGDWLSRGEGTYHYHVLYPHTLALVWRVFGEGVSAAMAWNACLSALAAALTARCAMRAGGVTAGVAAGGLFTLLAPSMHFDAHTLPESLVVALAAAALLALIRLVERPERAAHWLGLGLLLGLLALARGNGLVTAAAVAAALAAWRWRRRDFADAWWRGPAALAAGAASPVLLVFVRNLLIGGEAVLVTSGGAMSWLMGNAADATGLFGFSPAFEALRAREGFAMSVTSALGAALETWRADPLGAVLLTLRKGVLLLAATEWPDNVSFALERSHSPLLRWNPVTFPALLGLAAGSLALPAPRRLRRALALWIAAVAVTVGTFYVVGKYRLLAAPALCAAAGGGLAALRGADAPRRRVWLALALGVTALSLTAMTPLARVMMTPAQRAAAGEDMLSAIRPADYANEVFALRSLGRLEEALVVTEIGLIHWPDAPPLLLSRGLFALRAGRIDEADALITRAAARLPEESQVLYARGLVAWARGQWAEAEAALGAALAAREWPGLPIEEALEAVRARRPMGPAR